MEKKVIRKFKLPPPPPSLKVNQKVFFPLDIEIGGGSGMFAINYSKKNPSRCLISFERTVNKFTQFEKSYKKENLNNLMPIHGDALRWIPYLIPPDSVDHYFILYSNLYTKKKQENLRFSKMPFMNYLIQTLKKEGKIILRTNSLNYLKESIDDFKNHWKLKLIKMNQVKDSPQTLFEKKFLDRSEKCYEAILEK